MYRRNAMGNYTVPPEILALKPRGTIVKKIKSGYYVYSHSQYKDEKTGKWKTSSGKLLGKIVPGVGYCPNSSKCSEDRITCFDYGEYLLASKLSVQEYGLLLKVFNPDEAMLVFALSAIYATHGFCGLKAADSLYGRSLFAKDFPGLKFSYYRIAKLLELIGRESKMSRFQQLAAEAASEFAVDGHPIATFSEENSLSSPGFKTASLGSDYMNLVTAIDVDTGLPFASRMYPGYMLDKSSFSDFMAEIGEITGKCILIDMGFSAKENLKMIEDKGGFFIIPVPKNHSSHKEITKKKPGRLSEFLYSGGGRSDLVEYREKADGNRRVIYYVNRSEAERLCRAYRHGLDAGKKGYTEEKYLKEKDDYGVIVLTTNRKDLDAKQVYEHYKKRWKIETFYDRLKNGLDFSGLNIDDHAMIQGLSFCMLIAGRIDARLLTAAKKLGYTRNSLIGLMKYLKVTDDENGVKLHNKKKDHDAVLEKLGISLSMTEKCLPEKKTEETDKPSE